MESQVSPKNIEARVEAMAAATNAKPVETPEVKAPETPATPEVKAPEAKAPEAKVEPKAPEVKAPEAKAPEVKAPEAKVEPKPEKKAPNDPAELRKWATKAAQEASAAREEVKALKVAIEKLSKKPVDYAALAKDPDGLKTHIEEERQEAIRDLQQKLDEKHSIAVQNETIIERMKRENDKENYPRWEKLFPLIKTLAANVDGRVNWNQAPGNALDEAYALADQLSPVEAPVVPAAPAPAPAAPVMTQEQIDAKIAAEVAKAKADARAEAEAALRAENNGGGIGSAGTGGRRDSTVSKEALKKMPLADLKKLISQ